MPAPWAAGAEARIVGRMHGQTVINVFHFATNTVLNDGDNLDTVLLELAEALLDCARTTLLPAVTEDYQLVQCDAKRIYPTPSDPIIATATTDDIGSRGFTEVSFAASLLNLRTGGGGRRGRGRKFLPPPGSGDITGSQVDPAVLLLLAQFATCMAGKFLGSSPSTAWRLGIFSRTNRAASGGSFDNSFRLVTQLSPKTDVAVMRSRRLLNGI